MEVLIVLFVLFVWIVCGFAGYAIGESKGRGAEGFWWGFLLGIVGVIIIGLYSPKPVLPNSSTPMSSTKKVVDKRREAILEAIRRDPTLAQDTSPQTLARLELKAGAIENEMVLREEVEQALSQQRRARALWDSQVSARGGVLLLGAAVVPSDAAGGGLLVSRPRRNNDVVIVSGSPAARAGMLTDDVLKAINYTSMRNINDLQNFMASASKGDHIFLHVRRGPHDIVLEVEL